LSNVSLALTRRDSAVSLGRGAVRSEILADGLKPPQRVEVPVSSRAGIPRRKAQLDSPHQPVYEISMPALARYRFPLPGTLLMGFLLCLPALPVVLGEEIPLTKNSSISEFQNRSEDTGPYDFNAPPKGMFRDITLAEGFDEELGFRRTQEIVPVKPTDQFRPGTAGIFIVFQLHQHYQAFQVFGRCFPEAVAGLNPDTMIGQDAMYIALEDESGYLRLTPPAGGWKPGRYKVEIHAGEQVNDMSLMGTMRFTVVADLKQ
jgi:hypothetical protein